MTVIDWRWVTGWPETVRETLNRKIGALSRHRGFHQKVGITNDPTRRWRKYKAEGWSDMEVIYSSSSYAHVQTVERYLIERFHFGECSSPGFAHNANPGGEGRPPAEGPYYVYVVNAPAYTRLSNSPFRPVA